MGIHKICSHWPLRAAVHSFHSDTWETKTISIQVKLNRGEEECEQRKQAPCKISRLQFRMQLYITKHRMRAGRKEHTPHKLSRLKFTVSFFSCWGRHPFYCLLTTNMTPYSRSFSPYCENKCMMGKLLLPAMIKTQTDSAEQLFGIFKTGCTNKTNTQSVFSVLIAAF